MPNAIPSRSFPSAMEEGALTLKLPRAPNHCRWMRFLLPITPISRARRMVACVAGDRRWKWPVSLSRRAQGGGEKMNPTGGDHLSVSQPKPLVAQPDRYIFLWWKSISGKYATNLRRRSPGEPFSVFFFLNRTLTKL